MSKESLSNEQPKAPRPVGVPSSGGYQPDEPLTGPPPRGPASGVRGRAPSVTLEPRVVRALELIALAQWEQVPMARGIAVRVLQAWEGERCDETSG